MKFEFEIPDEKIQEIVAKHAAFISKYGSSNYSLDAVLKNEVERAIRDTAFKPVIEKKIREKSERLINESIDTKLGGWVKRKVKEFIKERLS